MPRFRKHIFICNNDRGADNPKGCCSRAGSPALLDYIKKRVHELGLKGIVRVNKAGCLDQCERGVTVVVYPEGVWYGRVTLDDVDELFQSHILEGRPVERLRLEKIRE